MESAFGEVVEQLCAQSRQPVAAVQRAGRAHPDVSMDVADTLTWAVLHACYAQLREGSEAEARRLADALTQICWNAIFAPRGR